MGRASHFCCCTYYTSNMGFFSFLFRRPVVLEDAFFGKLTQEPCDFSESPYCWYAASVLFAPAGAAIECMIDGDSVGPSVAQRAFFQKFEKAYADVLPKITVVAESDSRLPTHPIIHFESTHHLAGLSIPQLTDAPAEWELWFEPIDNSQWGYTITVDMIDDLPQPGIGISA